MPNRRDAECEAVWQRYLAYNASLGESIERNGTASEDDAAEFFAIRAELERLGEVLVTPAQAELAAIGFGKDTTAHPLVMSASRLDDGTPTIFFTVLREGAISHYGQRSPHDNA